MVTSNLLMRGRIINTLLALASLCLFFSLASPTLANEDIGRDDPQAHHLYGDIDLVSQLKYQYGKPKVVIKSIYPELFSENDSKNVDDFNSLVTNIVQQEIDQFLDRVASNQPVLKKLPKSAIKNNLYIDTDVSYILSGDEHILSLRFTIQGFIAGMAHPYHYHIVLNYLLDIDEKMELSDLFKSDANYLEVLSHYTRQILLRRLQNADMVIAGTEPTIQNFKNWNIKANGLLITFDEYQVAPYVNGTQTVLVPFSALKEILSADSPLAACIKQKRKCARNNLLIGGFIDEAINTKHRILNPALSKI